MDYHKDTKLDSNASSYSVEGYDPNRIPLSIFATKPSNPVEWSIASTESLFSITLTKNGEPNLPSNDKSSIMDKYVDLETQEEYHELKLKETAFVDTSGQVTMQANSSPMNLNETAFVETSGHVNKQANSFPKNVPNSATTQENVDENKTGDEERPNTRGMDECAVLETVSKDEISDDKKASSVDRVPNNNTLDTELKAVDQAPDASSGGWFSGSSCPCFSWKLPVCCGGGR